MTDLTSGLTVTVTPEVSPTVPPHLNVWPHTRYVTAGRTAAMAGMRRSVRTMTAPTGRSSVWPVGSVFTEVWPVTVSRTVRTGLTSRTVLSSLITAPQTSSSATNTRTVLPIFDISLYFSFFERAN